MKIIYETILKVVDGFLKQLVDRLQLHHSLQCFARVYLFLAPMLRILLYSFTRWAFGSPIFFSSIRFNDFERTIRLIRIIFYDIFLLTKRCVHTLFGVQLVLIPFQLFRYFSEILCQQLPHEFNFLKCQVCRFLCKLFRCHECVNDYLQSRISQK